MIHASPQDFIQSCDHGASQGAEQSSRATCLPLERESYNRLGGKSIFLQKVSSAFSFPETSFSFKALGTFQGVSQPPKSPCNYLKMLQNLLTQLAGSVVQTAEVPPTNEHIWALSADNLMA